MKTEMLSERLQKAAPYIDRLTRIFLDAGWKYLPDDPDAKYARMEIQEHAYTHPRIRPDRMDTELLGRYVITSTDFNQPGARDIFTGSISVAALHLQTRLSDMTTDEISDALTIIVAVHESVHWIMHVWRSPKGHFLGKKSAFDNSSLEFDEGLAQLITSNVIANDAQVSRVFEQLCRNQSRPYRIHRELADHPIEKVMSTLADPVVRMTQSWQLLVISMRRSDRKAAFKRFIDLSTDDVAFERFRMLLREYRPDLADGVAGVGEFRGRIMAKSYGM